jgi:hypothetical protein
MVVDTCNSSTWEAETGGWWWNSRPSCFEIVRSNLKIPKQKHNNNKKIKTGLKDKEELEKKSYTIWKW